MGNDWIKLYRAIQNNHLWYAEPFTRGQAWVDLLLLANYKESTIIKRGIAINIERGQVACSEETLSQKWKWSRGKLRRFLEHLSITGQISRKPVQQNKHLSYLITIENYNSFQDMEQQTVQQTDDKQDNRRYRTKKDKKDKEKPLLSNQEKESLEVTQKKEQKFPPSEKDIRMSKELVDFIRTRDPDFKEPNILAWATHIEKLHRIDGRDDYQLIFDVLEWSQQDKFWQSNILSTANFRKHFPRLLIKYRQSLDD